MLRKLSTVLPIHLIMGTISIIIFFSTLKGYSHSGAIYISLFLLCFNIIGYILFSFLFLKNKSFKTVIISTTFFFIIGLFLWIASLTDQSLGTAYIVYHIVGYSSSLWLYENYDLYLGIFHSFIPSLLIIIGFYFRQIIKSKIIYMRFVSYLGIAMFSLFFVYLSGRRGKRIETQEDLATAFPVDTGFPFKFGQLDNPKIDPPLPHYYGGDCCTFSLTSMTNFWLSVLTIFGISFIISEIIFALIQRKKVKRND